VSKVTAGATGALGKIKQRDGTAFAGYSSDNLSSMVEKVTAGATGALGNISMTDDNGSTYGSSNLSGMMAKITAGATGALGSISMTDDNGSTYDSSDLSGMMAKITAGATGGLAYITSGAHSSSWTIDNATLTTQIKSGGSGALGNIRMSGFDHDNSSSWSTYTTAITGITKKQMGGSIQGKALSLSVTKSTFAGTGLPGAVNTANGTPSFMHPRSITSDGTNLYVAERGDNNMIRQIVISTGVVTTVASASDLYSTVRYPTGITTDGTNLYVASNSTEKIIQIVISTGVISAVAGGASFGSLYGITTDGTNLYTAQGGSSNKISQIVISTGVVTVLSTSTVNPSGITTDGTNVYVADRGTPNLIRQIVISTGVVTTLAGSGSSGSDDGTGTAASFNRPTSITSDGTNLYLSAEDGAKIRKVVISTGEVSTIACSSGCQTTINKPSGITTDGTNLYLTKDPQPGLSSYTATDHIIIKIE